ncbi:class I SAM-dependent methyltransferase [Dactylosporangium sp. NPDC000521]|uniref:class I SAM-dependent methyltransferase n=1 Tax=Dactylosporangium sp. NPDC000521 TaxID=3363975 RepID=UPI0036A70081
MTALPTAAGSRAGVADRLLGLVHAATGEPAAVRLRAWDGSEAGPADGPVLVLRDRALVRRLLWHPGELGLAQAYVAGEIDVDGDLDEALRRLREMLARLRRAPRRTRVRVALGGAAMVLRLGLAGGRPPAPAVQATLTGSRHSRRRDQAVIAFHYDLSNDFYELVLDPSMAYSCAWWPDAGDAANTHAIGGGQDLAGAQVAKLDLICRKLDLRPGARLLDVGCGWGALACHAARNHGARVTAVTISRQQHAFVSARIAAAGLTDLVELRLQDHRDLAGGGYDAVAAIEMGEHVGADEYPAFAARLHHLLRPGGRLLVQQMSRGRHRPGGGAFIEAYIAPDMHMRPVGATIALLEAAGLEVRGMQAMREHYARTIRHWAANLERHWPAAVDLVGVQRARVWRLYLAGGARAFEEGRMGVDQILAVRPAAAAETDPRS